MAGNSLLRKRQIEQRLETRRGQRLSREKLIIKLEELVEAVKKHNSGNSGSWRDLSLILSEIICQHRPLLKTSKCPRIKNGYSLMDYADRRMNSQKSKIITAHLKKCPLCRLTVLFFKVLPRESSPSKRFKKKQLIEELTVFIDKLRKKSSQMDKEIESLQARLIKDFSPFSFAGATA